MKTSRVLLEDAVEYIATKTKSARKVGIQNGMPTDFEQSWLHSAAVANCVDALGKRVDTQFANCESLRKLARRARVKTPALGVALLHAYFTWSRTKPAESIDRTKQCEPGCSCGLHGLTLGADRGLIEVYDVLRKWVPALPAQWGKTAKTTAAEALADAYVLLSEWVDKWNAKQPVSEEHMTAAVFARHYEIPLSTVKLWCKNGRLKAYKVSALHGGHEYYIDVSDFAPQRADDFSENVQEAEYVEEIGITAYDADVLYSQ